MDEITMRSLIIKHQRIIVFAENIENLYTYIALMMLLSDTIIICCLGFIIVSVSNMFKLMYFNVITCSRKYCLSNRKIVDNY